MHQTLRVQHRMLVRSYAAYMDADAAWLAALRDAADLFPGIDRQRVVPLGAPRSRLRRLHDARDAALETLVVARIKLRNAQGRISPVRPRGALRLRLTVYPVAGPPLQ